MSSSTANTERQIAIPEGAENIRAGRIDADVFALKAGNVGGKTPKTRMEIGGQVAAAREKYRWTSGILKPAEFVSASSGKPRSNER